MSTGQYSISVLYTVAYFTAQLCVEQFSCAIFGQVCWHLTDCNEQHDYIACIHSFTSPFIHLLAHSFTHSCTHALIHPFSHSFTHSACHSLSSGWQMRIVRVRRVWRGMWHVALCAAYWQNSLIKMNPRGGSGTSGGASVWCFCMLKSIFIFLDLHGKTNLQIVWKTMHKL